MRPPPDLPVEMMLLGEAYARRAGIDPDDWWDYCYKRKPWPPKLRAAILDAFSPALTPSQDDATLATVNTTISSNALRSRARISDEVRNHRFVKALTKKGVTFAEAAEKLTEELKRKVPRSTVQAWCRMPDDPNYRATPDDAADACLKLWGVAKSSWHRVIPKP